VRAGPIAFRDEARPLAIIYGPKRAGTAITDREDNGGAADKVLASFFREVGMVRAGAAGSTVAPPDWGPKGARNGIQHGRYTAEAMGTRRLISRNSGSEG
jgi:hypothetical protein